MMAALAGAGVGLGILLVWSQVAPPRPNLRATIGRWDRARRKPSTTTPRSRDSLMTAQIGTRLVDGLNRRGIEWTQLRQDLAILRRSADAFFTQVFVTALVAVLAIIGLGILASAIGLAIPAAYVAAGCVLAGLGGALLEWAKVHDAAKARRQAFRQGLSSYLDLVAMCLAAGRGHPEALAEAARIGSGWAFQQLQDTIVRARHAGITPWAALGEVGEEYGVQELTELSGALKLVGDDGAKIRDSLTARAVTLRAKLLEGATGKANDASETIGYAQFLVALVFLAYLMYPPLINLVTA